MDAYLKLQVGSGGVPIPDSFKTDLLTLSVGMIIGFLVGRIEFPAFGAKVGLGNAGGQGRDWDLDVGSLSRRQENRDRLVPVFWIWWEEHMAILGEILHTTTYRYAKPVTFGTHRAMFLPWRGASSRLLNWSAKTSLPSRIHWTHDARSNTVTVMEFSEPGSELIITFRVRGIYFGVKGLEAFPLESRADEVPVQYTPDEWTDLAGYLRPHADDPDGSVAAWTKSFVAGDQDRTADVLRRMLEAFRTQFSYRARDSEGTQSPGETLSTRSGTCRDFAWLMIETLRRLGFACRFVSGYLYDAALDGGATGMTGSGATHAWLQVFLPGAGWLHYDPTNSISAGFDLIPVAYARHPGQAIPLVGTWFGDAGDYLGMQAAVAVHKEGDIYDPIEG